MTGWIEPGGMVALLEQCGAEREAALTLHKERLLPVIERYSKLHSFQEVIPISALKGEGLEVLLDKVIRALPQSPPYFPEDQLTDQPERFLASEIIREKVLLQTGKEVPYATAHARAASPRLRSPGWRRRSIC